MSWDLHALVIQKETGMTKAKAENLAFKFLTRNVQMRETEDSWRFDNIPKEKFKKFRSHVIKEGITLIMGDLK
jgi:hypothetical protein